MGPKQRGMGVVSGFFAIVLLVLAALVAIKVTPVWIEYFSLKKVLAAMTNSGDLRNGTIADVRKSFDRRADIDNITVVSARDLNVKNENGEFVVYFDYQSVVPLFGNASLVFDFAGSSKDTSLMPRARRNE
jgi:hypothetical protein